MKDVPATPLNSRIKSAGDSLLLALNHRLGRFRRVAWILGEGRSGSTWLSSLVDADRQWRQVFEPFHPHRTPELESLFAPYQYLRPDNSSAGLEDVAERLFSGRLHSPRTHAGNRRLIYDGLLIKDIFANLLAPWVHRRLPGVRKVLLLRHPMAVARSKLRLDDWFWMREPTDLLGQNHLMADHLGPFEGVIRDARGQLEKYVVLWCISTLVPLRAFRPGEIHVVFYENLLTHLDDELAALLDYLGRPALTAASVDAVAALPSRTSRVVDERPVRSSADPSEGVEPAEFRRAMDTLEAFGLAGLYGGTMIPDPAVAHRLLGGDDAVRPH